MGVVRACFVTVVSVGVVLLRSSEKLVPKFNKIILVDFKCFNLRLK